MKITTEVSHFTSKHEIIHYSDFIQKKNYDRIYNRMSTHFIEKTTNTDNN